MKKIRLYIVQDDYIKFLSQYAIDFKLLEKVFKNYKKQRN